MRALYLGFGLFIACNDQVRLDPPLDPATRSVLVIADGVAGRAIEALDRTAGSGQFVDLAREDDLEIHSLQYEVTLAELGLAAGAIALDPDGELVPAPLYSDRSVVAGADAEPWQRLEALPDNLSTLRIARRSTFDCLTAKGCLMRPRPELAACGTPCPMPPMPEPPLPPEPPSFLPCPAGWAAIDVDGVMACDPLPSGLVSCPPGEALFPGQAGCEPLGPACAGHFPTGLPSGRPIRYVDPAAPPGGDGSSATPYKTIGDAMAVDTVLALAIGDYDERVSLPNGATLIGACTSGTRIAPLVADPLAVITVAGGSAELMSLSIVAQGSGLSVFEGNLSLDGVEVRVPSLAAIGINVESAGLVARRTAIDGGYPALAVGPGSVATFDQLAVFGGERGLQSQGELVLRDALIFRFNLEGVYAFGGTLLAERTVISGTGGGIRLQGGVSADLADILVTDVRFSGILAESARLTAQRVRIERYLADALLGIGVSADVDVADLIIRDPAVPTMPVELGRGVESSVSAHVKVERALVVRARQIAFSTFESADLELIDGLILDTRSHYFTKFAGRGVETGANSSMELTRVAIHRSHEQGARFGDGSRSTATDLLVEGTLPRDADDGYGRGIEVVNASTFDGTRVAAIHSRNLGFYVFDPSSRGTVRDLLVTRTSTSTCIQFQCNAGFNDGMAVSLQGELDVDRFAIVDNGLYGVRFVNDSQLHLKNGRISGQETGVQIVSSTYDLNDLGEGVMIVDNPRAIEVLSAD